MKTNKVEVVDTRSKESKIIAGAIAVTLISLSVLAVASQKLVDSIKTDEDKDRSW